MHHSTKRRVVLGMTTGGLLVGGLGMGIAQADAAANGATANSPGLLSGNLIQIPIDTPVNACGNSISVVGILDSAAGNRCAGADGHGAAADGGSLDSPGVASGNLVQIPVDAPVNVCGNSVSGVGVLDGAEHNTCSSAGAGGSGGSGGTANGGSSHSPGIGSGNTVQLPVNAPVNVCGNSVSVLGIGDTAVGNACSHGSGLPTPPPCGCHPTPPVLNPPIAQPAPHRPAATAGGGLSGQSPTGTASDAASLAAPLVAGVFSGGLL